MPVPKFAVYSKAQPPSEFGTQRRRMTWQSWFALAATFATMLPALIVIAKFTYRDVLLTGDLAIIDARLRDIGQGTLPLLGPYSSQWSHPGPLFFYVLAPLHYVSGGAPWALVVGGVLLHLVTIGLAARLAWRRGGLILTLGVLAVLSLSTLGATDRVLLDPWNPHVAMPFVVLFILQLWSVTLGDRWQILGAAVVGSFLVQTHLGYAPIVAVAITAVVVIVFIDARRSHTPARTWSIPLATAAGATIILWSTAIYEQFTGNPGNVTLIARYFGSSPEGQIGIRSGAGTFAALFRPLPVWLGGAQRFQPLTFQPNPESLWWLAVPAGLLAIAAFVGIRRRLWDQVRLLGLVALLTGVGIVSLSRLKENAWSYMSLWRIPLAIIIVLASAWTLWSAWSRPTLFARQLAIATCCIAILGGVIPVSRDILSTDHVASGHTCVSPIVSQLRDQHPSGRVLVRSVAPALWGVTQAVIDDLDRRGVNVVVDENLELLWGSSRVASVSQADEVWIITEDGMRGALLEVSPGAQVLASTSPLAPAEDEELSKLQRELSQQLDALGRPDLISWLDHKDFLSLLPEMVHSIDRNQLDRITVLLSRASESRSCRSSVVRFSPDNLPVALAE